MKLVLQGGRGSGLEVESLQRLGVVQYVRCILRAAFGREFDGDDLNFAPMRL